MRIEQPEDLEMKRLTMEKNPLISEIIFIDFSPSTVVLIFVLIENKMPTLFLNLTGCTIIVENRVFLLIDSTGFT